VVAGVLVHISSTFWRLKANQQQRLPLWGGGTSRPPWQGAVGIFVGTCLIVAGSRGVASTEGGWFAIGLPAFAVAALGHIAVVWAHNQRVSSGAER
jgi:hypothetical protein